MVSKTLISFPYHNDKYQLNFSLNRGEKFRNEAEAKSWFENYLKKFFTKHPEIHPKQIRKINQNGVILIDGKTLSHPDCLPTNNQFLWKTLPLKPERSAVPDQEQINQAEPPEIEDGIARADFEFLDPKQHPHLLDQIPSKRRWASNQPLNLSKQSLIDLETAFLVQQTRENGHSPTTLKQRETRFGVGMGVDQRRNYRMTVLLDKLLKKFFQTDRFTSDDIFAKNSPLNGSMTQDGPISGAITSSFNRLADTVTLMRKVEAEDGSSDCYTGRVDTEETAKELAQFIFLGEIDALENNSGLSKGIHLQNDGAYQLTFAVQSLLSMSRVLSPDQRRRFFEETKAFQKLIEQTKEHPLEIKHPITGKIYRVVLNPLLPIAANQFNFINRIESAGFGKNCAQAQSSIGDASLAELAYQKIQELAGCDNDRVERIQIALKSLQDTKLKPWQIVMSRAYLCHLLEIPQVIHCLGSVDRTGGVVIPMIVAMNQWLRSKRPIPSLIYEIVNTPLELPNHSIIYPFKNLCYYKMIHELKSTEFSRGCKGYKLDELGPLHFVHPACSDLLPESCFHRGRWKDRWAIQNNQVRNRNLIFRR